MNREISSITFTCVKFNVIIKTSYTRIALLIMVYSNFMQIRMPKLLRGQGIIMVFPD